MITTILVSATINIQNFESIANPKGDFFVNNGNYAPIELADNPNKSGINTSDKVAKVQIYVSSAISGIIKISFSASELPTLTYPACPTCTGGRYDRLRFKYYKGSLLNRYVEFEPNGAATSPKTLIQASGAANEWEYITIPLDWSSYQSFQIRVNRNAAGTGSATAVAGDFIYIDDFEFYNSTDGITTSVKPVEETKLFTCIPLGNKAFKLESFISDKSNVQIDLISLDGKCRNIYNRNTEGNFEIPFEVSEKGLYCVRMIVNNEFSEVIKIIAQ